MKTSLSLLHARQRLLRDLERLDRVQRLTGDFREALSRSGAESAIEIENAALDALLRSAAEFVERARMAAPDGPAAL